MKINLNPMVEMTNEEKETLRAFVANFEVACNDIADCDNCPLHSYRDDYNLNDSCPSFINSVLYTLGIFT